MAERNGPDQGYVRLGRLIAIAVDTILIAFTAVADTLGRLYIRPDFHVSEVLFATLVGSWLVLLGFEGIDLIRTKRNGNGHS